MALEKGMIEPFEGRQMREGVISYGVSSYGYDMRVAREFKIFTNVLNSIVDPKNFDPRSFVEFEGDVCIVPPNSFALARSVEYFRIPRDVVTVCVGKSTYARCFSGDTRVALVDGTAPTLEELTGRAARGEMFWGYSLGEYGRIIVTQLEAPRFIAQMRSSSSYSTTARSFARPQITVSFVATARSPKLLIFVPVTRSCRSIASSFAGTSPCISRLTAISSQPTVSRTNGMFGTASTGAPRARTGITATTIDGIIARGTSNGCPRGSTSRTTTPRLLERISILRSTAGPFGRPWLACLKTRDGGPTTQRSSEHALTHSGPMASMPSRVSAS